MHARQEVFHLNKEVLIAVGAAEAAGLAEGGKGDPAGRAAAWLRARAQGGEGRHHRVKHGRGLELSGAGGAQCRFRELVVRHGLDDHRGLSRPAVLADHASIIGDLGEGSQIMWVYSRVWIETKGPAQDDL